MPVSPTLTELNRELNRIRANDLCNINAVLYRVTGLSSLLGEYNYTRMMGWYVKYASEYFVSAAV